MLSALIAFALMAIAIIALPLIVTLIYKHFYNVHVNKNLDQILQPGKQLKKWITPLLLFLILVPAEIILLVVLGMAKFENSDDYLNLEVTTMTINEADSTMYANFDGSDVSGYDMETGSEGDFTYIIYTNQNDDQLPVLILRITYTGEEDVHSWSNNISAGHAGLGAMGDFDADNDYTLYMILDDDSRELADSESFSFTLSLYPETMDAYDTGSLGTYEMPEPAAEVSIQVPYNNR